MGKTFKKYELPKLAENINTNFHRIIATYNLQDYLI